MAMALCDAHPDLTSRLDRIQVSQAAGFARIEELIERQNSQFTNELANCRSLSKAQFEDIESKTQNVITWKGKALYFALGASWVIGISYSAYRLVTVMGG
jgi:ribose 1,5-bisphosphokinase PhnN